MTSPEAKKETRPGTLRQSSTDEASISEAAQKVEEICRREFDRFDAFLRAKIASLPESVRRLFDGLVLSPPSRSFLNSNALRELHISRVGRSSICHLDFARSAKAEDLKLLKELLDQGVETIPELHLKIKAANLFSTLSPIDPARVGAIEIRSTTLERQQRYTVKVVTDLISFYENVKADRAQRTFSPNGEPGEIAEQLSQTAQKFLQNKLQVNYQAFVAMALKMPDPVTKRQFILDALDFQPSDYLLDLALFKKLHTQESEDSVCRLSINDATLFDVVNSGFWTVIDLKNAIQEQHFLQKSLSRTEGRNVQEDYQELLTALAQFSTSIE